jgi:Prenyltransferase and squalene oxidase repeat
MDLKNTFDARVADHAIEKGIAHLLSQTVNGRWNGFPTLAGESDIWVTGFVLAHICSLCKQKDVLKESQNFLLQSIHPSGGWSYSAQVPPDADSSSWCLMALQLCAGFTGLALEKARAFLWSHFTSTGISTYHVESGIREFISAPDNETIVGWTAAHPDVSIAAILADIQDEKVPAILNWLINRQTDEGFINSYWWRGPYYTTTLLLRALTRLKQHLPGEHAAITAAALVRNQLGDGGFSLDPSGGNDPFTTALALESFTHLSYLGHQPERMKCGNALLLSQQDNGSWAGDFILRIPAPFVKDPSQVESWNCGNGGGNSFIEDKGGVFATAMACYALDCWRQTETQK